LNLGTEFPGEFEKTAERILELPSFQIRLLLVCHCYREDGNVIRIMSARKADRSERNQYSEFLR
jgi:uncharacterized DUF497 family protein